MIKDNRLFKHPYCELNCKKNNAYVKRNVTSSAITNIHSGDRFYHLSCVSSEAIHNLNMLLGFTPHISFTTRSLTN